MTKIELTVADLREIKQSANAAYLAESIPKELEGPEFLVLCYTLAVDRFLNKKGVAVDIKFNRQIPYEIVEE